MNHGSWLFVGVFLTFASSWLALVFFPKVQMDQVQAQVDEVSGEVAPQPYSGQALAGRAIYIREGCIYCHSQQVRHGDYNADLLRGWGSRPSHPRDYLYDYPQLLGTMRTGPDLANIGVRQPSADWHLKHLYNPQITSPGSIMPPYPWLFELRPVEGQPSPAALQLPEPWTVPQGYELVPTREALDLVRYLQELRQDDEIEEAASP